MKQIYREEFTGVVAEYKGGFWGIQYMDGHSTCKGFGSIENADVSDPKYCSKPTDKTYNPSNCGGYNPDYNELEKSRLVKIKKIVVFEIEE